MTDMFGSARQPSLDQRKMLVNRIRKMEDRSRDRQTYIYDQLKDMTDEQLNAVTLMFASILSLEKADDSVQQAYFYQGVVQGFHSARGAGEEGYVVTADDIFPDYKKEDRAEIDAALNEGIDLGTSTSSATRHGAYV